MPRLETALIVNDLHIPYHDKGLVELVLFGMGKKLKPDVIFLNGDIIDNYPLSRYPKHPTTEHSVLSELQHTRLFLQRLRREHKSARIVYVFGNHEARFESYMVNKAPELYETLNLVALLGLDSLGVEPVHSLYRENWYQYHDLYVGHWDKVSKHAGHTASALVRELGVSILQGHAHRIGQSAITLLDRSLYAYENPCLIDLSAVSYTSRPNWQQGFAVVSVNQGRCWVELVPIQERGFVFRGQYYSAR